MNPASLPAFQTLVLDIGNVLLPFDFNRMAARAAAALNTTPAAIHAALDGLPARFETGRLTEDQFFHTLASRLGGGITPAALLPLWCDIFDVNHPMVALLRSARAAGIPVFLLSNTNSAHARFFESRHPFILETDGRVYSHLEGVMKPDPLIFHRLIARHNITPSQTLYVDDLEKNILTARALGFHTWLYHAARHHELLAALPPPLSS